MLFNLLETGAQSATDQPKSNAKYSKTIATYKTPKQLENLNPGFWVPIGLACVSYFYCNFLFVK